MKYQLLFFFMLFLLACQSDTPTKIKYPVEWHVVEIECQCPPNMFCASDYCLCKYVSNGPAIIETTMNCGKMP